MNTDEVDGGVATGACGVGVKDHEGCQIGDDGSDNYTEASQMLRKRQFNLPLGRQSELPRSTDSGNYEALAGGRGMGSVRQRNIGEGDSTIERKGLLEY